MRPLLLSWLAPLKMQTPNVPNSAIPLRTLPEYTRFQDPAGTSREPAGFWAPMDVRTMADVDSVRITGVTSPGFRTLCDLDTPHEYRFCVVERADSAALINDDCKRPQQMRLLRTACGR
jgi:hypothetical protein